MTTCSSEGIWRSLWVAPHRPLFFLAGLWALVAPGVWLLPEGLALDRVSWHRNELFFGMGGAAVGGYLLTALPAWTKRGPISPAISKLVTILWLAARLVAPFNVLPLPVRAVVGSVYFFGLALILGYHLLLTKAWDRLWAVLATATLGIAAALSFSDQGAWMYLEGINGTPLLFVTIVVIVGGRAVPAFTRHWLERTGDTALEWDRPWLSRAAIAVVLGAAYLGGTEHSKAAGSLLVVAALLLFARTAGWYGYKTFRYPALLMLHIAWMWTPAALLVIGSSLLNPNWLPLKDAVHAITMGAMGSMMMAIMMRTAMIRKGPQLVLSPAMATAFSLVCLSSFLRIQRSWIPGGFIDPVALAALCWMTGWALFLWSYLPALSGPLRRPVLSSGLEG
ncbi:NnrS family protein [Neorhizobium alkalisoli]|uniref:NnrS family protein n=1 Tax=Neorhizobium alkalisoli TaxID=528178 RepID=UPI000CFA0F01|nr:NnrS family protein [Neorhizobium alkalisoli]